ncbi:MAG TPA: PHP domain-containing protein [Spirochaetia bacterium]|nr:PHP domain-containing protein [Spirochaetia bacterium]
MIDLHTHSTFSDGSLRPRELVRRAVREGLSALALTDHDTVEGTVEAREECARHGLEFIAGVELEATSTEGELHILGLDLQEPLDEVERALDATRRERTNRNVAILRLIRDDGVEAEMDEVEAFAGGNVVGRPHFAAFLVRRGIAATVQDAFDRFLGRGKPYYLPRRTLLPEEVVELIKTAGGRPIIAHPMTLGIPAERLGALLKRYRDIGIEGVEAYHSGAPLAACREIERIARDLGLRVTAGSDFHGDDRKGRRLGRAAEGMTIDDAYLSELRR